MIKKFYATKDNTITNAYQENLKTRGTGSNMGASDILEVFSIYGQASSTSSELARILIQFEPDFTGIPADAKWYLKMYNAAHSQTVPSKFDLSISPVSSSWEEGYGMDMEYYEDLTRDGVGSNWINRSGDKVAEITKFEFTSDAPSHYGAGTAENYVKIYNGSNLNYLWFSASATDSAGTSGTWTEIDITGLTTSSSIASAFQGAVNSLSDFSANLVDATVYVTASTSGAPTSQASVVGTISGLTLSTLVEGTNATQWNSEGGDYLTANATSSYFETGLENLEVEVTDMVNVWKADSSLNHGFGVALTSSVESETKSFYTKRFFGRDSEFHFQKPVLEARWDSSLKDDRGLFYASSSLASADDNLNTLYLYNVVKGRLRDYPIAPTSASIRTSADVSLVSASVSRIDTGIYKAQLAVETSESTVYDVWYNGSTAYHTGTISVKNFASYGYSPENEYVLSMPSLKKEYRKNQTHRFNLYVREKNWSPNIYTVAQRTSIPSLIIPSASFQLRRSIDDLVVIPYGTGSTMETIMSYDVSGNYFDLDTSYLESGYLYETQFSFYDEQNGWQEQPYRFKFRVVD